MRPPRFRRVYTSARTRRSTQTFRPAGRRSKRFEGPRKWQEPAERETSGRECVNRRSLDTRRLRARYVYEEIVEPGFLGSWISAARGFLSTMRSRASHRHRRAASGSVRVGFERTRISSRPPPRSASSLGSPVRRARGRSSGRRGVFVSREVRSRLRPSSSHRSDGRGEIVEHVSAPRRDAVVSTARHLARCESSPTGRVRVASFGC